MSEKDTYIDELFREGLQQEQIEFDPSAWAEAKSILEKRKPKKKFPFYYGLNVILFAILSLVGLWGWISKEGDSQIKTVQNELAVLDTEAQTSSSMESQITDSQDSENIKTTNFDSSPKIDESSESTTNYEGSTNPGETVTTPTIRVNKARTFSPKPVPKINTNESNGAKSNENSIPLNPASTSSNASPSDNARENYSTTDNDGVNSSPNTDKQGNSGNKENTGNETEREEFNTETSNTDQQEDDPPNDKEFAEPNSVIDEETTEPVMDSNPKNQDTIEPKDSVLSAQNGDEISKNESRLLFALETGPVLFIPFNAQKLDSRFSIQEITNRKGYSNRALLQYKSWMFSVGLDLSSTSLKRENFIEDIMVEHDTELVVVRKDFDHEGRMFWLVEEDVKTIITKGEDLIKTSQSDIIHRRFHFPVSVGYYVKIGDRLNLKPYVGSRLNYTRSINNATINSMNGSVEVTNDIPSSRTDLDFTSGAQILYFVNRSIYLNADFSYDFASRNKSFPGAQFDKNVLRMSARIGYRFNHK